MLKCIFRTSRMWKKNATISSQATQILRFVASNGTLSRTRILEGEQLNTRD